MKKYLPGVWVILLLGVLTSCQTGTSFDFTGHSTTDTSLTNHVQQALYLSEDPVVANVRAESIDKTVYLTGYVKKISQSDEAETIAKQIAGVKAVKNDIIVRR